MEKPKSIKSAIKFMYFALFWSIIGSILILSLKITKLSLKADGFIIIVIIIYFLVNWFFILKTSQGKSWARTVYFVIFVVTTINIFMVVPVYLTAGFYINFTFLMIIVVTQFIAVVKLFSETGKVYFKNYTESE